MARHVSRVAFSMHKFILVACLILIVGAAAGAQSGAFDLVIRNDYIAISVNASDENTGRFALETTGGDPIRTDDDQQPLLYKQGGSGPRTSYTTVRVDGVDYVFGNSSPSERAGFSGEYGTMVQSPTIVEEDGEQRIVASWLLGNALVTQELGFARSSTTGLFDTAEIRYIIENVSDAPSEIGLRILLDTMLGANDGAPFRVGEQAILTDTTFSADELPDFWQAFDSLTEPRVIGQGTFRGAGITTPDRVYLSNWGALADGVWDFSFVPGRDFTRLGEFNELDSAMALYWDPVIYQPGERREYVTQYGLGGISIVRGALSLGITSPASIDAARESSFPVVVYVQNTGEGDALDVAVRICVPRGLTLSGNQSCATRRLGDLPLNREAQVTWTVFLDGAVGGELEYTVEATAENLPEPVRVQRKIDILGPPRLAVDIDVPTGKIEGFFDRWNPPKQPIVATVTNIGATTAKEVVLSFSAPVGMELTAVDRAERLIGELRPNESWSVTWYAALLGYTGNLPFTVTAVDRDSNIPPVSVTRFLDMIFPQHGYLAVGGSGAGSEERPARVGDVVAIDVQALNVRRMGNLVVELTYDPTHLRFVEGPPGLFGALRGDLFRATAEEKETHGGEGGASVRVQHIPAGADGLARIRIEGDRAELGPLPVASGKVASLRFIAQRPGTTSLGVDVFRVGGEPAAVAPDAPSQIERHGVTVHIAP